MLDLTGMLIYVTYFLSTYLKFLFLLFIRFIQKNFFAKEIIIIIIIIIIKKNLKKPLFENKRKYVALENLCGEDNNNNN